ncbi:hypothetical protein [Hymenobacter arizonensis]|uniref:hypothetical protein n=1 Tax=Hymenobacter arizonensis TaxID=1227077 RepID=UPI000B82C2E7|nr:hypothetical protein [Hymenobacter arizonensis]
MVSLAQLQAQLRPLVGAEVLDGDLLIFPTDAPEGLFDTSTALYLSTTAGAFALDLFPDGQTPRVRPAGPLEDLPRQEAGLAARRPVWARLIAELNAGQPVPLGHERFALATFPDVGRALHARIEQIAVYAFADDHAPTGLKLVFPDVVVQCVPGLSGNVVLCGELHDYFAFPVREHPV